MKITRELPNYEGSHDLSATRLDQRLRSMVIEYTLFFQAGAL